MPHLTNPRVLSVVLPFVLSMAAAQARAAVQLSPAEPSYAENFDGLPSNQGSVPPSASPAVVLTHWQATTNQNISSTSSQLVVDNGTSSGGGIYSYGATGSSDRALGSIGATAAPAAAYATSIQNAGDVTLFDLTVLYTGEHWHLGQGVAADTLSFAYSTTATSIFSAGWTAVPELNYGEPADAGPAAARDGNADPILIQHTISGLNLAPGEVLWIRWSDANVSGSDHGMAIDNVTLTATFASVPEPTAILGPGLLALGLLGRRRRHTALCAQVL